MSTLSHLLSDNTHLIRQGLAVLGDLDGDLYCSPLPDAGLSGIGGHFRHCIDFYERFLACLAEDNPRLDYDSRDRDEQLERCPSTASARLEQVVRRLETLVPGAARRELLIKSDAVGESAASTVWARSTVERELQVLLSHTVHHYALIAVALRLHGLEVDPEFGVAPSTLRYWQEQRACAR